MIEVGAPHPGPPKPLLRGTVVVRESTDDLIDAVTADLVAQAVACVRSFGDFHLALSANQSTEPVFRRLMYDPACRALPWRRTHLWLADECWHGQDAPESRFSVIRDYFCDHSDIPREQVHPVRGSGDDAALAYQTELREVLGWRERGHDRPDYILLALDHRGSVGALRSPQDPPDDPPHDPPEESLTFADAAAGLIGFSLHFINAARFVGVVAAGEAVAPTVARMLPGVTNDFPAGKLKPLAGELRWYLDFAACGRSGSAAEAT